MVIKTVGILSPGEMGHSIGVTLGRHGLRVVTCLQGRSQRTRQLAESAGIASLPSLLDVVTASDIILSVVVPSAALELGREIAAAISATGRQVLVADANAVSPMTSIAIGDAITAAGGRYVDVSIIGTAANLEKGATFYVSGERAADFAALQEFGLRVQILGGEIGQASAFKMVYAGLTKGLSSLAVELLVTARALGILDQILEKYRLGHPEIAHFMAQTLPGLPLRAARRSQEMEELSATIKHVGLDPVMAPASGAMLKRIGELKLGSKYSEQDESQWSLQDAVEVLYQGLRGAAR